MAAGIPTAIFSNRITSPSINQAGPLPGIIVAA
jgi:hypothetical protein